MNVGIERGCSPDYFKNNPSCGIYVGVADISLVLPGNQQVGQHPPVEHEPPAPPLNGEAPIRTLNAPKVFSMFLLPHLSHLSSAWSEVTPTKKSNEFSQSLHRYVYIGMALSPLFHIAGSSLTLTRNEIIIAYRNYCQGEIF